MSTAIQRWMRVECLNVCDLMISVALYPINCLISVSIQVIKFMPIDLYFIILANK